MKKAWKVILIIVLIAVILGAVCVGVGIITGADTGRIYQFLDSEYNIGNLMDYYEGVFGTYQQALAGA